MLHLRLRVPAESIEEVLSCLQDDDTVTNVAVVPHGFCKPEGALVLADAARESATHVIARLKAMGVAETGSISLESVDTVLSAAATRAEQVAPGAPDDGVVWDSMENHLRNDVRLSWSYVVFMLLAVLIAGVGRITDQPILIVGAMVVGPEFAPVAALCFSLVRPRPAMLLPAAGVLVGGYLLALSCAAGLAAVAYRLGAFTRAEAGHGQLTDFIVQPDAWSLAVACFAGIAGVLSLSTAKSGPLVGVFISVTTVPAVGAIAICLACGLWAELGSAAAQLGINLTGMIVAGTLTLMVQRVAWGAGIRPGLVGLRSSRRVL